LQLRFRASASVLPKIYAVVIGVAKYQRPVLNLKYADKDALAFADFLKSPGCGSTPAGQIALLVNENATRANVLKAIRAFSSLASSNDVLIIYYSGHGTNNTQDNNLYLETYDTDEMDPESTATAAQDIKSALSTSSAKMKFWITDACNSGKIQAGKGGWAGRTAPSGAVDFLREVAKEQIGGFVYIASSESREISVEDSIHHRGLFTYYLLEGLRGKADEDGDGIVTIDECYNYLRGQVMQATGNYQHPILGDLYYNGSFPMSSTGNYLKLENRRNDFKPRTNNDAGSGNVNIHKVFDKTILINTYTHTGIFVTKGENVSISATGAINVGPAVGDSGPDGRSTGLLYFSLTKYNIVKTFKHAVLMLKLNDLDPWTSCGSSFRFIANKDGEIIFQVNDNDQGNNSGAYTVTIRKYK
jgi:hypothetical protein